MMFVNDIVTSINTDLDGIFSIGEIQLKLFLILFADDQVLFSTSPATLQTMLNDIETYCNVEPTLYDFYLHNEKLEIVTLLKYLGVHFLKTEIGTEHKNVSQNMPQMQYIDYFQFLINMSLNPQRNVNYLILLFYPY